MFLTHVLQVGGVGTGRRIVAGDGGHLTGESKQRNQSATKGRGVEIASGGNSLCVANVMETTDQDNLGVLRS